MKKNILISLFLYFSFLLPTFAWQASNDSATMTVPEETQKVINVLANDDGVNLRITKITAPTNGSAWQSGAWENPTVTYQPNWSFIGTDTFNYTIKQNGSGAGKTATVTVTVNGPPVPVANNDTATTDMRQQVAIPVLSNDTGYNITFDWDFALTPAHGSAWTSGSNIVYQPNWDYAGGTDTFQYRIKEDRYGRTSTATITVTVIPAPPVPVADTETTEADVPVTIPVLANDSGIELSIVSVSNPPHGSTQISGSNIIYTPDDGFEGTDTFTYTVRDIAGQQASAGVSVMVTPPNPAGGMRIWSESIKSERGNSRIDGTRIRVLTNGTYVANTVVIRPQDSSALVSLNGLEYVLVQNTNYTITAASVQITVILTGSGTSRYMQFTNGRVSVIPMPLPAPLVSAVDDYYNAARAGTNYDIPVCANDTGAGSLTVQSIDSLPIHGTATIRAGGIIRYNYSAGYSGEDSLTYTMVDTVLRTASATLYITCGALPEINAADDTAETQSGVPVTIPVLVNDTGFELSIISVAAPSIGEAVKSGDNIIYTPPVVAETIIVPAFSYTIEDYSGATDSANITVTVTGSGPVESGPLMTVIRQTTTDAEDDLNGEDIEKSPDDCTNPNIQPPLKLLMYKQVFDYLNTVTDQEGEFGGNDRGLVDIINDFQTLFNERLELENGTSVDTQGFKDYKDVLLGKLEDWQTDHPLPEQGMLKKYQRIALEGRERNQRRADSVQGRERQEIAPC